VTCDDLIENLVQNDRPVYRAFDSFELRQSDEVCSDNHTKLIPLSLTLLTHRFARFRVAWHVLDPYTELLHFDDYG